MLQLLSGCGDGRLPGHRPQSADGLKVLRYVNNGPSDQPVILSVGSSERGQRGVFRLDVAIGELLQNGTCARRGP